LSFPPCDVSKLIAALAAEQGLVVVGPEALTLRRVRCGKGFGFRTASGAVLRDAGHVARLRSLAMPPAYMDVRYATDPAAHLQAVGTDAAGRLQYRYHPKWTEVREALKARRLGRLARALPTIRRAVGKALGGEAEDAALAIAAVVHLVSLTAIRAGGENYARDNGTRGASTLLKSNVKVNGSAVALSFKAKGGKAVTKNVRDIRLARALQRLLALPGRRLFQYRDPDGTVRQIRARDVNGFLREVVGRRISLKDFRTLVGSTGALEALSNIAPAASQRARRSQLKTAMTTVAEALANTPAIARKSYVHSAIVDAFEDGRLARLRKAPRSSRRKADMLARLVARHAV
jgi:DNA topoisomerase-1